MAQIPSGGGSGGGSGWIKITDVTVSGGTATNKVYQDPPNNTILQEVTVSGLNISVNVSSSYPVVDVDGNPVTLDESVDGGHYSGTANISISGSGSVIVTALTGEDQSGAVDSIDITATLPAELTLLSFTGSYPGAQTELKEDDTFQLAWTSDAPIDALQITDYGTCKSELITFASASSGSVTVTIADRGDSLQTLSGRASPRDAISGAFGAERDTNLGGGSVNGVDVLQINNLHPTLLLPGPITYPGIQEALKGSEQATLPATIANADTIAFDSPNGDITITNPTTIEATKTVTRIAGTYNITTNNFRGIANRAANDADTTRQTIVQIANDLPTIDITLPYARLRSGGNDSTAVQDYTVTITSNHNLLSAPTLATDSGGNRGTFQGGGFVGGPTVWTRTIRIDETVPDEKGVFAFESLVAVSLASATQNTINSGAAYTLGGFVVRDVSFQAFQTISDSVGVEISDFSKIQAGLWEASDNQSIRQPIGTSPPVVEGYTSQQAVGANPHNVEWLDTVRAGSSSGVSRLFGYEEVI